LKGGMNPLPDVKRREDNEPQLKKTSFDPLIKPISSLPLDQTPNPSSLKGIEEFEAKLSRENPKKKKKRRDKTSSFKGRLASTLSDSEDFGSSSS